MGVRNNRVATMAAAGVLTLATVAACGGDSGSADNELALGASIVLSGPAASYGEDQKSGIEMAVKELNDGGGILGRQVKVEYVDEQSKPDVNVRVFRELANNKDIPVILGPSGTLGLLATMDLAESMEVPTINLGSTGRLSRPFNDWVFRANIVGAQVLPDLLSKVVEKEDIKSMAIVYDQALDYSVDEAKAAQETAEAAGVTVVGSEAYTSGDQEFGPVLSKATGGESVDMLYVSGLTSSVGLIAKQATDRGVARVLMGGAGMSDPAVFELSQGAAEGAITFFPTNIDDPDRVAELNKTYKAEHGRQAPPFAVLAYDSTMLAAHAIEEAGSTNRAEVRAALASASGVSLWAAAYTYDGSGDHAEPSASLFVFDQRGEYVPY